MTMQASKSYPSTAQPATLLHLPQERSYAPATHRLPTSHPLNYPPATHKLPNPCIHPSTQAPILPPIQQSRNPQATYQLSPATHQLSIQQSNHKMEARPNYTSPCVLDALTYELDERCVTCLLGLGWLSCCERLLLLLLLL